MMRKYMILKTAKICGKYIRKAIEAEEVVSNPKMKFFKITYKAEYKVGDKYNTFFSERIESIV